MGCAHRDQPRASTSVIESVDPSSPPKLTEPSGSPVWTLGVDRIYRVGDSWVARQEGSAKPILLPAPTRRLLTTDAQSGAISFQPAPLAQELVGELYRLRELAERNRDAMNRMETATAGLAQAAQEMLARNTAMARLLEEGRSTPAALVSAGSAASAHELAKPSGPPRPGKAKPAKDEKNGAR